MKRFAFLPLLLLICACQPKAAAPLSQTPPPSSPPIPTSVTSTSYATQAPTLPASPTPTPSPSPQTEFELSPLPLTITVVYDNIEADPHLETAWGFSALIEGGGHQVLFDTGGDGSVLMQNISALDIDPDLIDHVVLSHIHGDHTGGLDMLLNTGIDPTIYVLPSFTASFKRSVEQKTPLVEVEPGIPIVEGMLSTGELAGVIPEQALIVRTVKGMVIVTGCAHPGIVQMVQQAIDLTGDPVYLVMGGFHLGQDSRSGISSIIDAFKQMGVERVAPSHCTGDQAIQMFREAYGDDFIESGAGCVISIET
jgi:7,8-dihydropterin-6-yl-methyl-4-(beta-D-ribofuranosyl)aminobenzene 5'-phosphate synthase